MASETEYIFYDGHCGLCHYWVKRVLNAGGAAEHFVFSPLQGDFITTRLSNEARAGLPDSIVVQTHAGETLLRSTAVLYVMRQLGGGYSALARIGRIIPRPVRDLMYVGVAKVRHLFFAKPKDACPMMPPEHRARFRF